IERDFRPNCGKRNARFSAGILLAPRAAGPFGLKTMDRRRYAGAAAQRIFQVDRPAVLFQQIAERFVGEFLKILHLIAAEKIDLAPSLVVELPPLTGHHLAFLWRPKARGGFLAALALGREALRRALLPPALRLWRSASIRLMTLDGARSFGRSIFSPFCLRRSRSLSASSYSSLNCCGLKWPVLVSTI